MSIRTVYFHGLPGGPEELGVVDSLAPAVIAPDRRHDAPTLNFDAYCDHLSTVVAEQTAGDRIRLAGFSMGAHIALEVATRLPDRVESIALISAAAPLQCGDFLPLMAGQPVFRAARLSPGALRALTAVQSALARWVPDRLFAAVFASARGADRELAQTPEFRHLVQALLGETLRDGAPGYRREIMAYVGPWSDLLTRVVAPVSLWHGTEDNWAPLAMADALAASLPNVSSVHHLTGLSHYSTLVAALCDLSPGVTSGCQNDGD